MNLQENFNLACAKVNTLFVEQGKLEQALATAQKNLDANSGLLRQALRMRDEARAMMSVIPPSVTPVVKTVSPMEGTLEDKQAVFKAIRQIPNTWVAPQGLAVLSGVGDVITAAILRRVSRLSGIPIEHNGKRGRASQYRWVSGVIK